MNREIKFRGKQKFGTEWITGDINHIDGEVFIFDRSENAPLNSPDWFEVSPETVCQYTGLKDKNGKEVYEGDVLKDVRDDKLFNWLVEWDNSRAGFVIVNISLGGYLGCRYPIDSFYYFEFREVIGNIHENPELLK